MSLIAQLRSTHIIELRARILKSICVLSLLFLSLMYVSGDIYDFVAEPLMQLLPTGGGMIATDVATPFLSPLKLTMMVSFILSIPYFMFQLWSFITPGLYEHERRLVMPLVFFSVLLFYVGVVFSYFVVFPLVFEFFTNAAPTGVTIATDISSYLDFVLTLLFAFGFAFEIPIIVIFLCWTGVFIPWELEKKRPYVIVWMFIIGMLITPPDIFSQTLIAIPMWLLWELGVLCSKFYCTREGE